MLSGTLLTAFPCWHAHGALLPGTLRTVFPSPCRSPGCRLARPRVPVADPAHQRTVVRAAEQALAEHRRGRCLERRIAGEPRPQPGALDGAPGSSVEPAVAPVGVAVPPGLPQRALAAEPGVHAD